MQERIGIKTRTEFMVRKFAGEGPDKQLLETVTFGDGRLTIFTFFDSIGGVKAQVQFTYDQGNCTMKVRALYSGFDGYKGYEANAILEGDSEHVQRLLFNGAAEPLDEQAQAFLAARDQMTDEQRRGHRMLSVGLAMALEEQATVRNKEASLETIAETSSETVEVEALSEAAPPEEVPKSKKRKFFGSS